MRIFISQGEGFRFASCSESCACRLVHVYWQITAGCLPARAGYLYRDQEGIVHSDRDAAALLFFSTKKVLKNTLFISLFISLFHVRGKLIR